MWRGSRGWSDEQDERCEEEIGQWAGSRGGRAVFLRGRASCDDSSREAIGHVRSCWTPAVPTLIGWADESTTPRWAARLGPSERAKARKTSGSSVAMARFIPETPLPLEYKLPAKPSLRPSTFSFAPFVLSYGVELNLVFLSFFFVFSRCVPSCPCIPARFVLTCPPDHLL